MRFRKAHLNFLIDAAALAAFVLLVATGFIMAFRLPPGTGGRHGGGGLTQLGWTRHDWGALHYWVSLILVGLILLHLILHWRWVWTMIVGPSTTDTGKKPRRRGETRPAPPGDAGPQAEKPAGNESRRPDVPPAGRPAAGLQRPQRIALSLAVVLLLLLTLLAPWLIPVRGAASRGPGRRAAREATSATRESPATKAGTGTQNAGLRQDELPPLRPAPITLPRSTRHS